jgi:UDP-N-acetylglucosamine 1-carboxyvinyltransferase
MGIFEVNGGRKLKGDITPQGAKNEALQVISAVMLTRKKVTISNIPDIIDVNLQIELLGGLGVKIERTDRNTCSFEASSVDIEYLASPALKK